MLFQIIALITVLLPGVEPIRMALPHTADTSQPMQFKSYNECVNYMTGPEFAVFRHNLVRDLQKAYPVRDKKRKTPRFDIRLTCEEDETI